MEKQILFEDGGLRALTLIILSCYPIHQELNIDAMMHVKDALNGRCNLDGRLLLSKLPALENSISQLGKKLGYGEISQQAVAEFFAGKDHYEKILSDFEQNKLHIIPNSIYSLRTIFAHLAMPIRIIGQERDGFVGRYENGKFNFLIKGLVASEKDGKGIRESLSLGSEVVVLSHFATVIVVEPERGLVAEINEMHRHLKVLQIACEYLQSHGGVDYNVFPVKCGRNTKEVFEKIMI